ncbi:MAG: hypothetical protein IPK79_10695 [Vampirovibrionales bacterium]|nr:hypothetical protein [Vampirovibrionales bacterium]
MPCSVCGGRVIKSESGEKCMNAACASSSRDAQGEKVVCRCGEPMQYQGLNQLGEPNYACQACGASVRL